MTTLTFHWHPANTPRRAFGIGAVGFAIYSWAFHHGEAASALRIISSVLVVVALALLVELETRVDAQARSVRREARLFGRFRVWFRQYPLSSFCNVALRRRSDPDSGDTVYVGLRRRSGGFFALQYFFVGTGQICGEAHRAAHLLSNATGLAFDDRDA
jgi:hypothetical protein